MELKIAKAQTLGSVPNTLYLVKDTDPTDSKFYLAYTSASGNFTRKTLNYTTITQKILDKFNINDEIGQVVRIATNTAPVGYLKCNGSLVRKDDYPKLYNHIGDSYSSKKLLGAGQPWVNSYRINNANIPPLNFTSNTTAPSFLTYSNCVVTNNYIYTIGGISLNIPINTVYRAPILTDAFGSYIGNWTNININLPASSFGHEAIVYKNKIHLIGVVSAVTRTNIVYTNNIYTANLNSSGEIVGSWYINDSKLGQPLTRAAVFNTNRKIYVLGGLNSSNFTISNVYSADIYEDGTLGPFMNDIELPVPVCDFKVAVVGSYVYLIGGRIVAIDSSVSYSNSIYRATIEDDGTISAFTFYLTLPIGICDYSIYVTTNSIFLIGGETSIGSNTNIYKCSVNPDNSISSFTVDSTLPFVAEKCSIAAIYGKLYIVSGTIDSQETAVIYNSNIQGGLNSYSSYYNNSYIDFSLSTDYFRLPDFSFDPFVVKGVYNYYIRAY